MPAHKDASIIRGEDWLRQLAAAIRTGGDRHAWGFASVNHILHEPGGHTRATGRLTRTERHAGSILKHEQRLERVASIVNTFPPQLRTNYVQRYVNGMSISDICRETGQNRHDIATELNLLARTVSYQMRDKAP